MTEHRPNFGFDWRSPSAILRPLRLRLTALPGCLDAGLARAKWLSQIPWAVHIAQVQVDEEVSVRKPSVERFAQSVQELYEKNRAVVFLCGPTLKDAATNSAAALRQRLLDALVSDGFEVVLGEDDGLEDTRIKLSDGYAHDNELEFIQRECSAIVLVANSVGSFCELGLFIHWLARNEDRTCDLILLADKQYENHKSYFNEGPARAVADFGKAMFVDFATADISPILRRLKGRRSTHFFDGRGRPAGAAKP